MSAVEYECRENVAPVRERGLKLQVAAIVTVAQPSRSRKGAWIEIKTLNKGINQRQVAPVRERGLKWLY